MLAHPAIKSQEMAWSFQLASLLTRTDVFPGRDVHAKNIEAAAIHQFIKPRGLRSVQNVTLPDKLVAVIHILGPERP